MHPHTTTVAAIATAAARIHATTPHDHLIYMLSALTKAAIAPPAGHPQYGTAKADAAAKAAANGAYSTNPLSFPPDWARNRPDTWALAAIAPAALPPHTLLHATLPDSVPRLPLTLRRLRTRRRSAAARPRASLLPSNAAHTTSPQ